MESKNYYTTGEMIDLISRDKELVFEVVSGKYDGGIVSYHEGMQWLMWQENNTYEPINISIEFMDAKWKLLSTVYALQINIPLMNVSRSYCLC